MVSTSPSSSEPGLGEVPLPSSPVPTSTSGAGSRALLGSDATPSPLPPPAGSLARQVSGCQEKKTTASPPALIPKPTTMTALLERAAKARGVTTPSLKRDRGVVPPRPAAAASLASPSPTISNRSSVVEKETAPAFHGASHSKIPLGSGAGGSDQDEIVSRFAASCL